MRTKGFEVYLFTWRTSTFSLYRSRSSEETHLLYGFRVHYWKECKILFALDTYPWRFNYHQPFICSFVQESIGRHWIRCWLWDGQCVETDPFGLGASAVVFILTGARDGGGRVFVFSVKSLTTRRWNPSSWYGNEEEITKRSKV
jgi:hypothetical protein